MLTRKLTRRITQSITRPITQAGAGAGGVLSQFALVTAADATGYSFSRPTVASVTDYEGIVRPVGAGEIRFVGTKRVQNLVPASSDLTHVSWTKAGGTTATASALTFTANSTDRVYCQVLTGSTGYAGRAFAVRVRASVTSGTKDFRLRITQAGVIDSESEVLTATTTPREFIYVATFAAGGSGVYLSIVNDPAGIAGVLNVSDIQCEEVTGQSIQKPGQFVATGAAAPYYGANIDGVKNFDYYPRNTCIAIGDSWTAGALYTARITATHLSAVVTASGVGGQKLTAIDARFAADVVAHAPDCCIIQGGINDLAGAASDPNASMQAAVVSMVAKARAANIVPVLFTPGPWKSNIKWTAARQGYHDTFRAWIIAYGAAEGLAVADVYAALVDPDVPQTLLPAYDGGDGLHPSAAGYRATGDTIAAVLPAAVSVPIPEATMAGYQSEGQRTNLLLNSGALSTQNVTVDATAYALTFYGTGIITLTGAFTAGLLVGTGANQRVTLLFTPTAGTLTLTVAGSVAFAQLEAGEFASSYIPTYDSAVTRNGDILLYPVAGNIPLAEGTFYAQVTKSVDTAVVSSIVLGTGGAAGQYLIGTGGSTTTAFAYDGTNVPSSAGFSAGAARKVATRWNASTLRVFVDGTGGTATSFDGSFNWVANFAVGCQVNGGNPLYGTVKAVRFYSTALPDATIAGM